MPKNMARAFTRIGAAPEAQARWLLKAAYADPAKRSDSDWANLEEEIGALLFLDPTDNLHYGHRNEEAVPREAAETCIAALRDGLRQLVLRGKWNIDLPRVRRIAEWWDHHPFRWRTGLPYILEFETGRREGPATIKRDWRGYFLLRVYDVLRAVERRFRVCLECRRAFIARKRQAYCTARCSQTVRTRKYRSRHRSRFKQLRRRAYERQVKAIHGPNVKVSKRLAKA
jgi:hypothetical protein